MRTIRRFFGILVAMLMVVMCVGGCGGTNDTTTTPTTIEATTTQATTEEVTTQEVTEEVTTEEETEEAVEQDEDWFEYTESWTWTSLDETIVSYSYVTPSGESKNIVTYNGVSEVNFLLDGPSDICVKAGEYADYGFMGVANEENSMAVEYLWDGVAGDTQIVDSDDPDYDLMITNGQFKYYYPNNFDETTIRRYFDSIRIISDDEVIDIATRWNGFAQ